jgi:transposase
MNTTENITISFAEYNELLSFKSEVEYLRFQLSEMKRLIFGSKSERHITEDPNQLSLFEIEKNETPETETETISYTRKKSVEKKQPLRLPIPEHLPRRTEVIDPENLPELAKKIGEEITETLEYTPATLYVRKIVRNKYVVEQNDEHTHIAIAELPTMPIPKGNAGASLLAHILISKFVDHLPFFRQVQMFKRQDVHIPESTINGWFNASCRLLQPLYEELKKQIQASNYIQADETPIAVLTQDKPGATHKGYHWVYHDPQLMLVLFDYQKTRGREGPDELLKFFSGFLQVDGYVAYNNLQNAAQIQLLACMAHARRKFEHALDSNKELAKEMLTMFRELYDIEAIARENNFSFDEIKEIRQREAVPVLQKMEAWLKAKLIQTLPKSPIGMAISYTLSLWSRLVKYCEDGRFCIDNNLIENCIRPVALGRKNYLFAGSHEAAQNAAMLYSFFATCKLNKVEPFEWLKNTLTVIPDTKISQLHTLLPGQR